MGRSKNEGQRYDRPADQLDDDDADDDPRYQSGVYELRTCYLCGVFLPIDQPAKLVGDDSPCCDGCFEAHH